MDDDGLRLLAERCEAASKPDRELDALIAIQVDRVANSHKSIWKLLPRYTASLDAAMTLVETHLRVALVQKPDATWGAALLRLEGDNADCPDVTAATAALALTAAALRARSVQS